MLDVAVIGAGFSGLAIGLELKRLGATFLIFEAAAGLGGTWRDNRYPGCACDIPSHLYSLAAAPNPDWSRSYSERAEILAYLEKTASDQGLRGSILFNTPITQARFDEARSLWILKTASGAEHQARFLVSAMGGLGVRLFPKISGMSDFKGLSAHSHDWDPATELRGKKVAIIGTGASAAQIIPSIANEVASLDVYQRTPAWIMPRGDRETRPWQRALYARFPALLQIKRQLSFYWHEARGIFFIHEPRGMALVESMADRFLRAEVPDPDLRERLRPKYRMGCKRVVVSDDYLAAFRNPKVRLITEPIEAIHEDSIETADQTRRPTEIIIYATGFRILEELRQIPILGRAGLPLAQAWRDLPRAHHGIATAGFPNLFFLLGPNTALGHNSVVLMIEAQAQAIVRLIQAARAKSRNEIEVCVEKEQEFNEEIQRKLQKTVWLSGCKSWYFDAKGRNFTIWPGTVSSYQRAMRRLPESDFLMILANGDGRYEAERTSHRERQRLD